MSVEKYETLNWDRAKKHFDGVKSEYERLRGDPMINVEFALTLTFRPIELRYASGERTKELYDHMMSVE